MTNKFRFFLLFLSINILSFAQEKDSVKAAKGLSIKLPENFSPNSWDYRKPKILYPREDELKIEIDGRLTNFNSFRLINPENIESINLFKSTDNTEKDCLVITTKPNAKQNIISLSDLIINYFGKLPQRIMFSIDGVIVNESPNNILVDEKYIRHIEVSSLGKVNNDETVFYKLVSRTAKENQETNTISVR